MSDKKLETKEQNKMPEHKTSGIFYVVLGQVEHMTDKKEKKIFKLGDVVEGLPKDELNRLVELGIVKEK